MKTERVSVTDEAKLVIEELRAKHGELIFHQSGGCCDGSAPMCFKINDFLIGLNAQSSYGSSYQLYLSSQ